MADGTDIGVTKLRGRVKNESSGVVLCLVQDDGDPEIFELGPNRVSPADRDVDAVKADSPCTLHGTKGWYKFGDHNTAIVTGNTRALELDFRFGSPRKTDSISDEKILKMGGVQLAQGESAERKIESLRTRGSAIWWGERL